MKHKLFAAITLFLILTSCSQDDKFDSLRKSFKSNLSKEEFKSFFEMNDSDFNTTIENTILKDCESNSEGDKLKELSKVDACRRILNSKSELSETEIASIIENVKSNYKLRKSALCW